MNRLRSVITLGPASFKRDIIERFLMVTERFRLNSSHMNLKDLEEHLRILKDLFDKNNKKIPVIIDLQGSKMRIGKINAVEQLPRMVTLFNGTSSVENNRIPVPHLEFFNGIKIGDVITLNDNRIHLEIKDVSDREANGQVIKNGKLSSFKGINCTKHPIIFSDLLQKDKKIIELSMEYDFTQFAYSFVFNGLEKDKLKNLTLNREIIAKIERKEAMDYLTNIDEYFDEIWLCRGDLGAQVGIFNLGKMQCEFSNKIKYLKKPCFLAGQVLEHMTHFPDPTRSEIVHLYDISQLGYKGFVLSDETAIGKNPLAIADFLSSLT